MKEGNLLASVISLIILNKDNADIYMAFAQEGYIRNEDFGHWLMFFLAHALLRSTQQEGPKDGCYTIGMFSSLNTKLFTVHSRRTHTIGRRVQVSLDSLPHQLVSKHSDKNIH